MSHLRLNEFARQLPIQALSHTWDATTVDLQKFVGLLQQALKGLANNPSAIEEASEILSHVKSILGSRSPSYLYDTFQSFILPILEHWESFEKAN